jgi:hypothetical protein
VCSVKNVPLSFANSNDLMAGLIEVDANLWR